MKTTPFHERTLPLNEGLLWYEWDQCMIPDAYEGMYAELRATRERVSMADMSPMSKYEISGPQARAFLDYLVTRDMSTVEIGQAVYTPWCDHSGLLLCDGVVFRLEADRFLVTADPHMLWFSGMAEGFDVSILDVTDDLGLLAVQGPSSQAVMESLTGTDWGDLPFSRCRSIEIAGVHVVVARQGFTGEHGYELQVPRDAGPDVWDAVYAAGEPLGISPAGEYAMDIARVEAGLPLVEYASAGPDRQPEFASAMEDYTASPFEIGLGKFVHFDRKADFIGREALAKEAARGPARRLVGLKLDWSAIVALAAAHKRPPHLPGRVVWDPLEVSDGQASVGRATSVTWAPTVNELIGFGLVTSAAAELGTALSVKWELGGLEADVPAEVVNLPFLAHRRSS